MEDQRVIYKKRSELAQETLEKVFWDESKKVYSPYTPLFEEEFEGFHYWWQAHVIDVLLDAYERTNHEKYIDRIDLLLEGVLDHNNGSIINDFYDDMEWMALALLRAYKLTGKKSYLDVAEELWNDIKTGWNDICGGGIAWQKKQLYYKNTPANAPAVILGLRLYRETNEEEDLSMAHNIFSWLDENLVDQETGFVWDGMNREENMQIDKDWEFTYCQGVYVGACVELYKLTKDAKYLKKAQKTIHTAFDHLEGRKEKVLHSEGIGDGGLFKGILIRYIESYLNINMDEDIIEYLKINGEYAWDNKLSILGELFGANWDQENAKTDVTLSTHLSGCMLMESIYRLLRVGGE